MKDEQFMHLALQLAQRGCGWTAPNPMVGAVIVKDGAVIGQGWHERYGEPHAERNALAACTADPAGATMYVTLEPCPMCAGAILNARIRRVYYGARDEVMGACGGVLNLFMEGFPRPPQLVGNVCGNECRDVLQAFFREVREKNAENTNRSANIVEDFTEF